MNEMCIDPHYVYIFAILSFFQCYLCVPFLCKKKRGFFIYIFLSHKNARKSNKGEEICKSKQIKK